MTHVCPLTQLFSMQPFLFTAQSPLLVQHSQNRWLKVWMPWPRAGCSKQALHLTADRVWLRHVSALGSRRISYTTQGGRDTCNRKLIRHERTHRPPHLCGPRASTCSGSRAIRCYHNWGRPVGQQLQQQPQQWPPLGAGRHLQANRDQPLPAASNCHCLQQDGSLKRGGPRTHVGRGIQRPQHGHCSSKPLGALVQSHDSQPPVWQAPRQSGTGVWLWLLP
jgi:hypothetical protein